ncbi:hypothetical protein [Porcipelethomonas sp.]|uniref:hypothetical protein n=1 Tax=Porcipelethomonas sp. TaxID=2981675 RepID=UPI003EF536C8
MLATLKREKIVSQEKTTYMEVLGTNRIIYRVTSTKVTRDGNESTTYGIEAETRLGPVRFKETIEDFSADVGFAVKFAEFLVKNNIKPSLIYNAALCFLRKTI